MHWKGGTWATEEHGLGFGDGNPDHVMLGSGGTVWLGGRMVRTLDLRPVGREFESWPLRYRVQPWASC